MAKTDSRSMLGSMNEIVEIVRYKAFEVTSLEMLDIDAIELILSQNLFGWTGSGQKYYEPREYLRDHYFSGDGVREKEADSISERLAEIFSKESENKITNGSPPLLRDASTNDRASRVVLINRAVVFLRHKEPAIQWINSADPNDSDPTVTQDDVDEEMTMYLVHDLETRETGNADPWVKRNWEHLFEKELEGWYIDEDMWPKNRTFAMFKKWYKVECHTLVEDTSELPIKMTIYE